MMQHALGSLADAWQQDHHQQVNNLASHAAAEQLLGNRSELTINRVVPPSPQVILVDQKFKKLQKVRETNKGRANRRMVFTTNFLIK
jgi:hypothetical protein